VIPLSGTCDPRAVANLLLREARGRGHYVSNLKLQKLLFLCHAFYLVDTGRPLVRGSFEAWQYGPVHREAYDAFKQFGANSITAHADKFDPVTGARMPLALPTDRSILDVVHKVVEFYGAKSPGELVKLTHAQGGPWDQVVRAAATSANIGLKISDEIIVKRFKYLWFGRQPKLEVEPYEDAPLVA
jgi:uncharacterized phage-associated protein